MLRRTHWLRHLASLDPETDYEEIYRITVTHEFPWDMNQALSFALFRTYAVPSIGRLLHETGEFTARTQKRYDDTALLLDAASVDGLHSERGRRAIRRINQMHRAYDISDDDMRYVLATFVVVPRRWIGLYGGRPLTRTEVRASTRYYQELGRLMGIRGIPATYDEFAALLDDYEAGHFGFDPGARRVADATLELFTTFYPRPLRGLVEVFVRAVMDEPLLEAFGYAAPPRAVVRLARGGLRARGRAERVLPARRRPQRVEDLGRIRSYPEGYAVEELGTFPRGCPAPVGDAGVSPARPAPR